MAYPRHDSSSESSDLSLSGYVLEIDMERCYVCGFVLDSFDRDVDCARCGSHVYCRLCYMRLEVSEGWCQLCWWDWWVLRARIRGLCKTSLPKALALYLKDTKSP